MRVLASLSAKRIPNGLNTIAHSVSIPENAGARSAFGRDAGYPRVSRLPARPARSEEERMNTYWFAGLTGALLWAGAASGADVHVARGASGEIRSVAVHAGDLDLARTEGAEELLGRLRFAAVRVCDAETPSRDLRRFAFQRACVKDTMDRAVSSVPSTLVKRLYDTSQGG